MPGREHFGIAGVWAPWKNPKTDQWEKTFSTFTSEPNALIEKIHIRQPVILEPNEFESVFSGPARHSESTRSQCSSAPRRSAKNALPHVVRRMIANRCHTPGKATIRDDLLANIVATG